MGGVAGVGGDGGDGGWWWCGKEWRISFAASESTLSMNQCQDWLTESQDWLTAGRIGAAVP